MVPPKLTLVVKSPLGDLTKISLCDATGKGSQRHSFRYVANLRLYPCSITRAPELGYLVWIGVDPIPTCSPVQLGGPFGFCAFALLSSLGLDTFVLDHRLGSLEIALKRTRPRQRFWYVVGRDCMTEGGGCQEGNSKSGASGKKAFLLLLTISMLELAILLFWYIFWL